MLGERGVRFRLILFQSRLHRSGQNPFASLLNPLDLVWDDIEVNLITIVTRDFENIILKLKHLYIFQNEISQLSLINEIHLPYSTENGRENFSPVSWNEQQRSRSRWKSRGLNLTNLADYYLFRCHCFELSKLLLFASVRDQKPLWISIPASFFQPLRSPREAVIFCRRGARGNDTRPSNRYES